MAGPISVLCGEKGSSFKYQQKQEATAKSVKVQKGALKKLAKGNRNLISITSHFVQQKKKFCLLMFPPFYTLFTLLPVPQCVF